VLGAREPLDIADLQPDQRRKDRPQTRYCHLAISRRSRGRSGWPGSRWSWRSQSRSSRRSIA
jgi:hypothetical protein